METLKFLHTADLHLDSALTSITNSKRAQKRRIELTDSFCRMARFAQENDFFGVIVAGDMFDVKNASPTVKKQVADVINNSKNILYFLLAGNHDSDAFDGDFVEMLNKNAIVLKHGQTYKIGNVTITGYNTDNFNLESVPVFEEECFNIVVMHGQTVSGNGEGINVKKLSNKNINYLALGHIHSYSQGKIDNRGKFAYCGCPEGRGFDELGEKGFVLFDTLGNVEFKPNCTRQCREVKVDISNCQSYITQYDKVLQEIQNFSINDMYKIVLTGEVEEGTIIDTNAIAQKLNDNVFFAKVVDQTNIKLDDARLQKEMSLRGEFFRVVNNLDLTEAERQQVLKFGFNAMDGLEIEND